jgi:N-terminal domain of reverse transcriptase
MASSQDVGAPSHEEEQWHSIDWASYHRHVRRLQTRLVKATQEGRWNKVKALQHLLTHSFAAKALAVKRVTENQGKRTPGVEGQPGPRHRPNLRPSCRSDAVATSRFRSRGCTSQAAFSSPWSNGQVEAQVNWRTAAKTAHVQSREF